MTISRLVCPASSRGVRRALLNKNKISSTDIPSSTITPLIAEKQSNAAPNSAPGDLRTWVIEDVSGCAPAIARICFPFVTDPTQTIGNILPSAHPGIVIVTYCDNHADKVPLDTSLEPLKFSPGP